MKAKILGFLVVGLLVGPSVARALACNGAGTADESDTPTGSFNSSSSECGPQSVVTMVTTQASMKSGFDNGSSSRLLSQAPDGFTTSLGPAGVNDDRSSGFVPVSYEHINADFTASDSQRSGTGSTLMSPEAGLLALLGVSFLGLGMTQSKIAEAKRATQQRSPAPGRDSRFYVFKSDMHSDARHGVRRGHGHGRRHSRRR